MGCCGPEHGGAQDPAGMWVSDSLGFGSRRWGGLVARQECNIGSCRSWSRRLKGENDHQIFSGKFQNNSIYRQPISKNVENALVPIFKEGPTTESEDQPFQV